MENPLAGIASAIVLACAPGLIHAAPLAASDPAVAAATKEMLAAMKAREMMMAVLAQMEAQMHRERVMEAANAIVAGTPAPEQKEEELRLAKAKLNADDARTHAELADAALIEDMIAALVEVYADKYTLDAVRRMTAFYASPLGQKMQANAPALMRQSTDIARWFVMRRLPKTAAEGAQAMRFREALTTAMQSTAQAWVEQTLNARADFISAFAALRRKIGRPEDFLQVSCENQVRSPFRGRPHKGSS